MKKHILEKQYPEQCAEFQQIVDELYNLFLDKGKEYSPNNVKAIGTFGISLRIMEKVIRSLNIQGYDPFEGKFKEAIKDVKFDSVEKELDDIANLAICAKILLRKKWAK